MFKQNRRFKTESIAFPENKAECKYILRGAAERNIYKRRSRFTDAQIGEHNSIQKAEHQSAGDPKRHFTQNQSAS